MKIKFWKLLMAMLLAMSAFIGLAQKQPDAGQILKRIEFVLCPDQKPVGQAEATVTPDVRIVSVKDFSDAQAYLLRMCPQKEIKEEKKAGNFYYTYTLPEGKGTLVLTDKVKAGTKEVAVLNVEVVSLKGKVKQVKFVK